QKDPFEEEAIEGLSSLGAEQARDDMSRLQSRLRKRVSGTPTMLWVRVAASVAVLLTIGTLYFTVFTDKIGTLNRRVAETESAEPPREKTVSGDILTMPEEEKKEEAAPVLDTERPGREKTAGISEQEEIIDEPVSSAISMREEEQGKNREEDQLETAAAPVMEEEVIIAEEETGAVDTMAYQAMKAEAVADIEGAGTEVGTELSITGDEITDAVPETEALNERLSMAQPMAMDETRVGETTQRSAAKSRTDATAAKKMIADGSAKPVEGEESFKEYIVENIQFPEEDTILKKGIVVLSFTVGSRGRPRDIEVEESPGDAFSREAIRLLEEGADWIPATKNGIPSEERTRLSIEFIKEKP
ncbi:MAG: energy transducer TonB, partial [Gammaproteobacteria bacterium]|nr:energy transducer TonB [Gammaproteobacteria bacterium]